MQPDPVHGHPTAGMHIWGWMSPDELEWLRATAAEMDSVVEVGCLHGRSAFALLTGCRGPVYCVDPWNDEHDKSYGSFMGNCGHFPNLVALQGYSPGVAAYVPGNVDMVFVDGAHDYDSVVADILGWVPKTEKLICGHDYYDGPDANFPGVKDAVDELFGDEVAIAPNTSIWTVRL